MGTTRSSMSATIAAGAAAAVAASCPGGFVGYSFAIRDVESGGTAYVVVDVHASFDDPHDAVLSVFNARIELESGGSFHHDDIFTLSGLSGHWSPVMSLTIPDAIDPEIDSFVRVGGPLGGASTTELDPIFDPPTARTPPIDSGWFNAAPANLQGRVDPDTLATHVARFVVESAAAPDVLNFAANLSYESGGTTEVRYAWDDGAGSGPVATIAIPAPPAWAMAAIGAASARPRRRAPSSG